MEKTNLIAATIRVPQELKKQLDEMAEKEHRSFNNFVNIILQEYIKQNRTADK